MLQEFATFRLHFPVKVHYGELRHFCDDPVCADPVWKLSTWDPLSSPYTTGALGHGAPVWDEETVQMFFV